MYIAHKRFSMFLCIQHTGAPYSHPNPQLSDVGYVTRLTAKASSPVSKYLHTTVLFFFNSFLLVFISCIDVLPVFMSV